MTKKTKTNKIKEVEGLTNEQRLMAFNIAYRQIENTTTLRRESIAKLLNPGLDIDYECRYPPSINKSDYKRMYDREGIAARVVGIYPDECWAMPPEIFETEEADKTAFELEWDALESISCSAEKSSKSNCLTFSLLSSIIYVSQIHHQLFFVFDSID